MYRPMIYGFACCTLMCISCVLLAVCVASGSGSIPATPSVVLGSMLGTGLTFVAAQLFALRMIEAAWPIRPSTPRITARIPDEELPAGRQRLASAG